MNHPKVTEWLQRYGPFLPDEPKQLANNIYRLTTKNPAARAAVMIVKQFHVQLNDKTEAAKLLATIGNEFTQMRNLLHIPQVVQFYEKMSYKDDIGNEWVFLLMEYCGESLSNFLGHTPPDLDFNTRIDIMLQLAKGLKSIQDAKTAHFDIKPGNVTYYNSKVKIIDFGTATQAGSTVQFTKPSQTMTVLGYTVLFAPPEVLESADITKDKIDVYCFGKTCLQLFFNIQDSQLSDYLLMYTDKISEKPLVYKPNKAKYYSQFMALLQGKIYPDDPTGGLLSDRINQLLYRTLEYDPAKRPTFERVVDYITHIHDVPQEKPSCYKDCEECYMVHPIRGVLYAVNRAVAQLGGDITSHVKSWPITALKGLTNFGSIFFPPQHVIVLGGKKETGEILGSIFAIDVRTQKAEVSTVSLQTPRFDPTLVTDGTSAYVLGGEGKDNALLDSCEECIPRNNTINGLPKLKENKARMAACIFNGLDIYVFGGELDNYFEESCTSLIHNYSTKVELLSLRDKREWVFVEVINAASNEWNGCGLSGACQYGTSILIFGGFIRNKQKPEYSWSIDQITFDPTKREFGKIEEKFPLIVEYFNNSLYCLKDNVLIASTGFTYGEKEQSFYSTSKDGTWNPHMLT